MSNDSKKLRRETDWPVLPDVPTDKRLPAQCRCMSPTQAAPLLGEQLTEALGSQASSAFRCRDAAFKTLEGMGYTWEGGERWKPPLGALDEEKLLQKVGGTEKRLCLDIARRQAFGLSKYGVTVDRNPLPLRQWVQHALEEAMDMAVYLRRIAEQMDADAAKVDKLDRKD